MRIIFIIFIILFSVVNIIYADTVILKDGVKLKGLVVEEYKDRIVLSTVEGEKNIFRKDIEKVEYNTPEQNFMQLGRAYDEKGWYDKASFYYRKAMEVNPDYKEAREAYLATHARIWQGDKGAKKELDRQIIAMEWWKNRNKKEVFAPKDKADLLKKTLGISLVEKKGIFKIDEVLPDSSAAKANIKNGDFLVGIWGKLISYSKMEDVLDDLLGPKYSEVKVLVEKEINAPVDINNKNLYKELGLLLGFEYEGLIIKNIMRVKTREALDFKKGDFIIAIDKNITRYLPMDRVIALINNTKNKNIVFTIRRNINLRREGE